jgi:hypothetical protein
MRFPGSSFSDFMDHAARMNELQLKAFGSDETTFTWTPQAGSGAQTVAGIRKTSASPLDLPPAFGAGAGNIILWVNWNALSPAPQRGDLVTYGGVRYTIGIAEPNQTEEGGGHIKLVRA